MNKKSIVFKITLAVSLLVIAATAAITYFTGRDMTELFQEYMLDAAKLNDPYPILQGGQLVTGPAERNFLKAIYFHLIWIGIPVTLLAFIISYAIARGSTGTIRRLSRGAARIAGGDLNCKVMTREGGEIGLLAASFNSMTDELLKAQTLRKQFFADAAHELKTPIAVIRGNLEGMIDGVIPVDQGSLNSLLEEADYLNSMIGDIKNLALADSGRLELHRQRVNVNDIVSACAGRLRTTAEAKGLTMTMDLKKDPLTALIDPERMTQVIYNLLINAGKYTPNGGSIVIGTEEILDDGTKYIKITVRDTGVGISTEDIPYVFERFYRTDKSRDKKTGGIGLGLSIVKKIVELHGGRAGVTSEPGKGSCFYVIIPARGVYGEQYSAHSG